MTIFFLLCFNFLIGCIVCYLVFKELSLAMILFSFFFGFLIFAFFILEKLYDIFEKLYDFLDEIKIIK